MSEYQYYQFASLDRPLTSKQMAALRAISTRATITSTTFVNVYEWGDLKADPLELVARYFDAHVYVTNWMSHRLVLKFSAGQLATPDLKVFTGDTLSVKKHQDHILLDFSARDESGKYEFNDTGEGWMPALVGLRSEIKDGDQRSFLIAWLADPACDDADSVPQIYPGLGTLTAPQKALAEFLMKTLLKQQPV